MPSRKIREVQVHTRAELQAALQRAERIVVEGDRGLAAYAAAMAGGGRRAAPVAEGARLRPLQTEERAGHMNVARGAPRLWPWVVGAAAVTAGGAAAVLLEHFTRATATLARPAGVVPALPPALAAPHDPALLAWPTALVLLILALFFVARRVLPSQSPSPPGWRVAEMAEGRVVIARVNPRAA
jgi:hypothetical protein